MQGNGRVAAGTSVRAEAPQANNAVVVEKLDRILDGLDDEVLVTTTGTAALLGIGSVNTIKAMVRAGQIQARKVGTHDRIPLTEWSGCGATRQFAGCSRRAASMPTSCPGEYASVPEADKAVPAAGSSLAAGMGNVAGVDS